MKEFFGESVSGSGGLHAMGLELPIRWPAAAVSRLLMEREVISFVAHFNRHLARRDEAGLPGFPARHFLELLAAELSSHWPTLGRPSEIAEFVRRFEQQA